MEDSLENFRLDIRVILQDSLRLPAVGAVALREDRNLVLRDDFLHKDTRVKRSATLMIRDRNRSSGVHQRACGFRLVQTKTWSIVERHL